MDTLGNKIVETGLRLYDRFSDRSKMPSNRRVYLETVLDKSRAPITEQSLRAEELDALRQIIRRKYEPIQPQLAQYENYLQQTMTKHEQAVRAKNKDRMLYPEAFARYSADLQAIRDFRKGYLSPEFIDLTQGKQDYYRQLGLREAGVTERFGVRPSVHYEDYAVDPKQARRANAGANPQASLHTLLGQFTYEAPGGRLVINDNYDFNPPRSVITGTEQRRPDVTFEGLAAAAPGAAEGAGNGLYALLRDYAGVKIPPGQGRPVRIQLNQLSPEPANAMAR